LFIKTAPAAWLTAPPMPDARELVRRYDGWSKVPPGERLKLSRAIVRWRKKHPQLVMLATAQISVGVDLDRVRLVRVER
jgi:hypothetical protein